MPELPRFYSTKQLPGESSMVPTSPNMAGINAEAMGTAGDRLTELGRTGWELSQKMNEAAESEKILNNHYKLKDDFRAAAEKFREDRDYNNFDTNASQEMDRIRGAYEKDLTSHNLRKAFDHSFGEMSSHLKDALDHKKAQIITENATGAFGRTYDEATNDYVSTGDPKEKEAIKANLALEAEILVSRNIMKPGDRDKLLSNFNSQADEVAVRNIGIVDPLKAYGMLMDKTAFPNIDPIRRVQLTEHMEVRARMEDGRQDKLNTAVQRENQSNALNDFAVGKLDFDSLMKYRANDPDTNMPGLSDAFFAGMLEKIKFGKDSPTDPKTFADLYLKEDLSRADIDANTDKLNFHDQRTLLSRILQEGKEDTRDAKSLRKAAEMEQQKEENEQKRTARERRAHYTSDARSYMKKAFGELGIESEEGGKMLRTFQGYVDDSTTPPEDLLYRAQTILETRKGGLARQLWNWMFPSKAKPEMEGTPVSASASPTNYGLRPDKTEKGPGFLGELKRPNGMVSTELSVRVNINGKETLIPSLVPTLTQNETNYLLGGGKPTKEIMDKAVAHARIRMATGKSPFKEWSETGTRKSLDDIFGGKRAVQSEGSPM